MAGKRSSTLYTLIPRSNRPRTAKSTIPPDVAAGQPPGVAPARPILLRMVTLRFNVNPNTPHAQSRARLGKGEPMNRWMALEVTVPRAVVEVAGWEPGMTICVEAYTDGRVRMYPAGDMMSREEEMI